MSACDASHRMEEAWERLLGLERQVRELRQLLLADAWDGDYGVTASEVETRTFDRGAPGYLPAHVDLFLAKAARALAGRDGETLTRWDVLRQRFPLGPRGYATSEVDAFLVRLAAQFPDPDPATQQEILRKLQEG